MRIYRIHDREDHICYAAQVSENLYYQIEGDIFNDFEVTEKTVKPELFLAPVDSPLVVGIALNYRKHAEETGKTPPDCPTLFLKTPASVQNPGGAIVLPRFLRSNRVDYEGELAVIIGRDCKNVSVEEALDFVLGYTCANDVSARDWQYEFGGGQFCRGKMFDTFAPLGPCLVTADEITDPQDLRIQTWVNHQQVQNSNTSDMIFPVARLISFISGSTTLPAGTVILTGTPEGVGTARTPPLYLQHGDTVAITIDKIGTLTNPVVDEAL